MTNGLEILVRLVCCLALFALQAKAAPGNSKTETLFDKLGHPQRRTFMPMSRCGIEDSVASRPDGRSKRYAIFGSTWNRKDVTYGIAQYSDRLDSETVDQVMEEAFAIWEKYANLKFTRTSSEQADIRISFMTGSHGDGLPFDGPARTYKGNNKLAHAFAPGDADPLGDIHFDDDEPWTIDENGYYGVNLLQIAVHEIGHALGLKHSNNKGAIMNKWYKPYMTVVELGADDIKGIEKLYGKKKEDDPDICDDSKIDAIFNSPDGHVYVFKGKHYWRLTDYGIAEGYPKLIATKWNGLPKDIDAAITYEGLTYFFKGTGFWTYDGDQRVNYNPPRIRKAFAEIPDDVDTAVVWSKDGKIYAFKGMKYWRIDPAKIRRNNLPYRKYISDWKGLPNDLDAAFVLNGETYFVKGDDLYRFDDDKFSVDSESPYKIRSKLFGCPSQSGKTFLSDLWDVIFS